MIDKTTQDRIDKIFKDYDHASTPGCALGIVQNGDLIYSRGYGMADLEKHVPITADTVFHLASVSKQFTATCIALLEEAGEISLEDDIHRYVSFLPDYGHELTLRHLVYMTNGLEDFYDVTTFIMGIPEGNYFSRQDAIRIIRAANWLKFPPGEQWIVRKHGLFPAGLRHRESDRPDLRRFRPGTGLCSPRDEADLFPDRPECRHPAARQRIRQVQE